MRRTAILIGVVVLAAAGLAWWFLREPTEAPIVSAPSQVQDAPFQFAATDPEDVFDAGVGRVSGRVVAGDDQAPVAGVRVRLYAEVPEIERLECGQCQLPVLSCDDPFTVSKVIKGIREGSIHVPLAVAETLSADDGTFSFEGVPLGGQVYAVQGQRSALSPADTEELLLLLEDATKHEVRVTDDEGAPLTGATVTVYSPLEGTLVVRRPNAEGRVTFDSLERTDWVFAEQPGLLTAGQYLESAEDLVLSPPRTLVIRTRMGGQPIDTDITIDLHRQERKLRTVDGLLRLEGLPRGFHTVGAGNDQLSGAPRSVELSQLVTEIDFELRRGAKLLVTVVTPEGDPLAQVNGALSGIDVDLNAEASDGALLILGPVPEGEYTLSVTAPGMVTVTQVVDLKPGESSKEITLRAAPKLQGTVRNAEGKPVPSARIGAFEGSEEIAVALADDDGAFELEFQYSGTFLLRAEETRQGTVELKAPVPGPPVALTLDAKGVLEVEVFDFDGTPVPPDLMVRGENDQALRWIEANEDASMVGRAAGLASGTYVLEKVVPNRLPLHAKAEVVEGRVTRLKLHLETGVTLSGRVVDHLGKPLEGVAVLAEGRADSVQSDVEGRFTMAGVEPGEVIVFAADATGSESDKLKVTAPASELVLTLRELPRVSGRAVDEAGVAVHPFLVNGETVSSADGRFDVPAPGRALDVSAEGYISVYISEVARDVGDVVLKRESLVEGDVVDVEGKPVSGASVMAVDEALSTTTDANGRFKLMISNDKPQAVVASRGALAGRAMVEKGRPMHLVMQKGTTVVGKVVDRSGRPTPTLVTATSLGAPRPQEFNTDENGRFEVDLSQGLWVFTTRANRLSRGVEVRGERLELTLGEEPGSCGAVVRSTKVIDGLWFLSAPLAEDEGPWDQVTHVPGSIEVPVPQPGLEVSVRGVPCGRYTLAASIENFVTTVPLDLRAPGQVVEVTPPVLSAAPEERAP